MRRRAGRWGCGGCGVGLLIFSVADGLHIYERMVLYLPEVFAYLGKGVGVLVLWDTIHARVRRKARDDYISNGGAAFESFFLCLLSQGRGARVSFQQERRCCYYLEMRTRRWGAFLPR